MCRYCEDAAAAAAMPKLGDLLVRYHKVMSTDRLVEALANHWGVLSQEQYVALTHELEQRLTDSVMKCSPSVPLPSRDVDALDSIPISNLLFKPYD